MKKYSSFLFGLVFAIVLVGAFLAFSGAEAAITTCRYGDRNDTNTGTSCAIITPCQNIVIYPYNHLTGALCPGVNPGSVKTSVNTSLTDFIVNSMSSMKYGKSSSLDVAILQTILKELGLLKIENPTGNFYSQTGIAVGKLQKLAGVKVDRLVGVQTKEAIKKLLSSNPKLAERIAEKITSIPIKRITAPKPGVGVSGGATGSSGTEKPRTITTCAENKITESTLGGVATITARSYFKLFKVTKDSKLQPITEDSGEDSDDGGEIPERENFSLGTDEKLLVVEIADPDFSENAVLGEFTYGDTSFVTNAGNWSSAITSIVPTDRFKNISIKNLEDELKKITTWGVPYELYNNSTDPKMRAIGPKAKWISAYSRGSMQEATGNKVVFYVTKAKGIKALADCGEVIKQSCPYPEEGTGDFDCKWPAVIPADPSPSKCGPSYLTEINATCTPTADGVEVNAEVVFAPGRASVTPYPYGVHLVIYPSDGSAPAVQLQHFVPTPYPTEFSESRIKFFYKSTPGVATPPLSKFDGKLVPEGPGGFLRNGLFQTDAMTKWAILQPTIKCTPPPPVTLDIGVTESCRGNVTWWPTPAQMIEATVTFSEAVKVTGVPVLKIVRADGTDGVLLSYVSGSDSKKLIFRYVVPDPLPAGFNYTKEDFMGDYAFKLPLPANTSIVTVAGSKPVILDGKWTAPDGQLCPTPNSISGKMCVYYQEQIAANYQVKFPEEVVVDGQPKLNIGGKVALYTGYGSSDHKTLNFLIPFPAGGVSGFVGAGTLVLNGGSIKDSDGNDVSLGLGTLTTAAADQCNPGPWTWTYSGLSTVTGATATKIGIGPGGSEGTEDSPTVRLRIEVKFNKPAYVLGVPELSLKNSSGQTGAKAEYVSGAGTDTLVFEHESNKPQDGFALSKYDTTLYPKFKMGLTAGSMHTLADDGVTWWPANTSFLNN